MSKFKIDYVDGHDLRYKSFETESTTKWEALNRLRTDKGDFDHRIIAIYRDNELIWEET